MPHRRSKSEQRPSAVIQGHYFNRELSWLAFNERVLDQACEKKNPLLERVRFLSFVSSNLSEFFEIRVAGILQQLQNGSVTDELGAPITQERLEYILTRTDALIKRQRKLWNEVIFKELRARQVDVRMGALRLDAHKRVLVETYFKEHLYPMLTPLALDPSHPFPFIGNKTTNIWVALEDGRSSVIHFAIVPLPSSLPRVLTFQDKHEKFYLTLVDVVKVFLVDLFPGFKVKGAWAFQLLRNSELYINTEEATNLLLKIEASLHKRHKGAAVRLDVDERLPLAFQTMLREELQLPPEQVFQVSDPISFAIGHDLYKAVDRPDLKYKPHVPRKLPVPSEFWETLAANDHLLHHPYDDFDAVVRFVTEAASDPQVLAIKQTVYRTNADSAIVAALKQACVNGKQVTALIELQARFDEANNIHMARELEEVGANVIYGVAGLKTHCKCCLVLRQEDGGIRQYAHIGTGNYNTITAKTYVDLSIFTANPKMTHEVGVLFNALTGFVKDPQFEQLWVAPYTLEDRILTAIDREIRHARAGHPAKMIAKVNSLSDKCVIDKLYEASQAGVDVDLIVRGICCLRPGVKGLSERIRVRSLLGRFFEHSRMLYFLNHGGEPEVLVSSADFMPRNLRRRIELAVPIVDPTLRRYAYEHILMPYFHKNNNAVVLKSNGAYAACCRGKKEDIQLGFVE